MNGKFFCILCLLLYNFNFLEAQNFPKREFRGAWIQTVNGQYQGMESKKLQELWRNQLNNLREAGINAILFQIRPEADAFYVSSLEPWSRFLMGVQGKIPVPLWDPTAFLIEECHKRGMEFHAWINPYRVKTNRQVKLASSHIYWQHPEWFVEYGNQTYFDPGLPESRKYICKVIADIVSRYDVDGIHMDDYFYPYPIPGITFPDDLSFARYGMGFNNLSLIHI